MMLAYLFLKSARLLLLLLMLPLIFFPPGDVRGEDASRDRALPPVVRLSLSKLYPLLQKHKYSAVIKQITEAQKLEAAKSASATGQTPNLRGYHHPEIFFVLGNCYMQLEKYTAAANAYHQTVTRDPGHSAAWTNLARARYEQKKYRAAGRAFAEAYATAAVKTPETLYYSAASYLTAGDHRQSLAIFARLLKAHPEKIKPEWKEHLIHALLAADRPRQALPHIRELVRLYSGKKKRQWQEFLLYQYLQLKMMDQALDLALDLTEKYPTIAKWWHALTHIQLLRGHEEEALAAMTISSYVEPLTLEQEKFLADLNLRLGIPVKSVPHYEHCLEKKTDKKLLERLVTAYQQLGEPEKALSKLDAIELDPQKDASLIMLKGEILYYLKKFRAAATTFRQAAQARWRGSGRAWLMVGHAFWLAGDSDACRGAFKQAARYPKTKKNATAALRQLFQATDSQSQPQEKAN
jgi:tetratricopeptide (TPR) repeat protein